MGIYKHIIGQVYSCLICLQLFLWKIREKIVISFMFLNGLSYIVMCRYYYSPKFYIAAFNKKYHTNYKFVEPHWFNAFYTHGLQICHCSLITIIVIISISKGFKTLGKLAVISLTAMWTLNEINLNSYFPEYFMYFCLLVYICFGITAILKLTKGC